MHRLFGGPLRTGNWRPWPAAGWLGAGWLGALLLCAGCAGRTFRSDALPAEFQAPPVSNAQAVDLSRLAGSTVSNELIERGDVLEVTIGGGYSARPALTMPVRVGEDGVANVPLVGPVPLAGIELPDGEQTIRAAALTRGVFRDAHVTVVMKQKRINRVTVVGAVEKPGIYELPRGSSDLLSAVVMAGGLAKDASTSIEVRHPLLRFHPDGPRQPRGDLTAEAPGARPAAYQPQARFMPPRSEHVDIAEAALAGSGGVEIQDGDVVMVGKRAPKPLQVIGLVNKPGQFDMPPNQELRVLDALALAGGVSSQVADKILVIRQIPGRPDPVVVELSLQEAKRSGHENLRLAPGDVVSVEQTTATVALDALKDLIHFGVGATVPIP